MNDRCREEFEKFMFGDCGAGISALPNGEYGDYDVQQEWKSWRRGWNARVPEGFCVVPKEPTTGHPSMCQKGAAAMWPFVKGGVAGHEEAKAIYTAMIQAAQEEI